MLERSELEKELDGSRREAERLVAKVHGLSAELEAARRAKSRASTNLGNLMVVPCASFMVCIALSKCYRCVYARAAGLAQCSLCCKPNPPGLKREERVDARSSLTFRGHGAQES